MNIHNIISDFVLIHKIYMEHMVIAHGRKGDCFTTLGVRFHSLAFLDYKCATSSNKHGKFIRYNPEFNIDVDAPKRNT